MVFTAWPAHVTATPRASLIRRGYWQLLLHWTRTRLCHPVSTRLLREQRRSRSAQRSCHTFTKTVRPNASRKTRRHETLAATNTLVAMSYTSRPRTGTEQNWSTRDVAGRRPPAIHFPTS